ncbi:adenosylcobinamide-GDP ribazoletransferase [Desulfatiferula olefinivorans]
MNGFFSALQFITILPGPKNRPYDALGMIPCFPLVGLLIGGLLAVFDRVALMVWPGHIVAVLDVVFLAVITGAFHLDGLADTADGLFSHRSKERMLEIMKDSRVGVMGLVALFCALAMKWAGLSGLPDAGLQRTLMLVTVPALARSAMIFGIRCLDYGRAEGTGKAHFAEKLPASAFRWTLIPLGLCFLLGGRGILLMAALALLVGALLAFYRKVLGCVTGDMLGAMTEVSEAVLFLVLAMGAGC